MPQAAEVEEWAKEDSHDEGKQEEEEVLQFVIKDKVSNICYRGALTSSTVHSATNSHLPHLYIVSPLDG